MEFDLTEILRALRPLVGLRLASASRAADMRVFQFGTLRPAPESRIPSRRNKPRGLVGDYALHIQCPWRIESKTGILTGRSDLWERPASLTDLREEDWDYERDGNLQDERIDTFMSGASRLVESANADPRGSFTLAFTDESRLVVFPAGTAGEHWRLFRPGSNERHFVVAGGITPSAAG